MYCKNLTTNITFQDIAEQVEGMIKSERVENRQTAQGLVSFFVTDISNSSLIIDINDNNIKSFVK